MPVLHLGVTEMPYTSQPPGLRKKTKPGQAKSVTTGDVAGFLENKYHVFEHLWQAREQEYGDLIVETMRQSLETLLMGGPATSNPLAGATSEIENKLKMGIALRELDALGYPGIPTKAAEEGLTARTKSQRGPPRPSFMFSGLYQNSIRVWAD